MNTSRFLRSLAVQIVLGFAFSANANTGWMTQILRSNEVRYANPQGFTELKTKSGISYFRLYTNAGNIHPRFALYSSEGKEIFAGEYERIDLVEEIAPDAALVCSRAKKCSIWNLATNSRLEELPFNQIEVVEMSDGPRMYGVENPYPVNSYRENDVNLHLLTPKLAVSKSVKDITNREIFSSNLNEKRLKLISRNGNLRFFSVDLEPLSENFQGFFDKNTIWSQSTFDGLFRPVDYETFKAIALPPGVEGFKRVEGAGGIYHTIWKTPKGPRISEEKGSIGVINPPHPLWQDQDQEIASREMGVGVLIVKLDDGLWHCENVYHDSKNPFLCPSGVAPQKNSQELKAAIEAVIKSDVLAGGSRKLRWMTAKDVDRTEARSCSVQARISRNWGRLRQCARIAGGEEYYWWALEDPSVSIREAEEALGDARRYNVNYVSRLQARIDSLKQSKERQALLDAQERFKAAEAARHQEERQRYIDQAAKWKQAAAACAGDPNCGKSQVIIRQNPTGTGVITRNNIGNMVFHNVYP